jgi:hypothetical protein
MLSKKFIPNGKSLTIPFTSDVVPAQFIQKAVDECLEKEYCKLVATKGMSTCGSSYRYYTSAGILIEQNTNSMDVSIICKTCFKQWIVSGSCDV